MGRAAIYIRVSTDYESQKDSPENQLEACKEYAEEIGLTVDDKCVYSDAGLSGTEMQQRTEVQRLLADARQGKFDAVLFSAISRFSRDIADALTMKKRLETTYGIRLISTEEAYDSAIEGRNNEMVFTVHAMLAAHKSKEMSAAIKRGLRQSARRGRHIGNITPYGYAKTTDKRLIPDATTAPVVRDIFDMYLDGYGSKGIAETLNGRGIKPQRAKLWQASTINAILHNQVYTGTIVAHKWTTDTDIEDSRRNDETVKRQTVRDEDEWVIVEDAHEAIVDKETFQKVQLLISVKATSKGVKRGSNVLAGLMKCGSCGSAMIVSGRRGKADKSYKYIVCSQTRRIGKSACNNHVSINYNEFLDGLTTSLQKLAQSKRAVDKIRDGVSSRVRGTTGSVEDRIRTLRQKLEQNETEQLRNLEAFQSGLFSRDVIEQGQRRLKEESETINKEITRLQQEQTLQEQTRQHVESLISSLNVLKQFEQLDEVTQRMTLRQLIKEIVFKSDKTVDVLYSWQVHY